MPARGRGVGPPGALSARGSADGRSPRLVAAVLDFGLRDGDTGVLCERLNARDIPFVLYTGYQHVHEACSKGVRLSKPASAEELLSVVGGLVH
jgi:hypothetical protein